MVERQIRVMHVDSDRTNKLLIRRVVWREFPHVDLINVSNGHQALWEAQRRDYDAFIIDLRLPDMQGDTLIALLRAEYNLKDKWIVALSGDLQREHLHSSLPEGADQLVAKPTTLVAFVDILRRALQGQEPDALH